ncbi:MAG: hypothetical protein INF92_01915 [Rhodobacter sp.]|nr:hypothetical protein [Rhodobacter sp.]
MAKNYQIAFIRAVLSNEYSLPVRMLLRPYRNCVLNGAQFTESDMRLLTRASWVGVAIAAVCFWSAFLEWSEGDSIGLSIAISMVMLFFSTAALVSKVGFKNREDVQHIVPDPGFTYNSSAARNGGVWAGLGVAIYAIYKFYFG